MNGFDVLLLCVMIAAVAAGCVRGFGRSFYDALGAYAALLVCELLSAPLAGAVKLHDGAAENHAAVYLVLFALAAAGFLVLAHFISNALTFNLGMFDKLMGILAGGALGLMLAHGIVKGVSLSDPTGAGQVALYTDGAVSNQVLEFPGYHSVVNTLTSMTAPHRDADAR